jgi:hypothetical protein
MILPEMVCSACKYPISGITGRGITIYHPDAKPFLFIGNATRHTEISTIGDLSESTALYACPLCGTVKVEL